VRELSAGHTRVLVTRELIQAHLPDKKWSELSSTLLATCARYAHDALFLWRRWAAEFRDFVTLQKINNFMLKANGEAEKPIVASCPTSKAIMGSGGGGALGDTPYTSRGDTGAAVVSPKAAAAPVTAVSREAS